MLDIERTLGELTLEEKASLVSGADFWHTVAVDRLGIPAIMCSDGPHGLRAQMNEADHVGLAGSVPATCFPTASAIASSWDVELMREVGSAIRTAVDQVRFRSIDPVRKHERVHRGCAPDPASTEPAVTEPPAPVPLETDVPLTTVVGRCPVGTWRISTDTLQGFYDTVNAAAGTDLTFAGRVIFTLKADGTFVYSMPDFVLTRSIDDVPTSVTLLGDILGTYEIVDGRFETANVNADAVEIIGSNEDASFPAAVLRSFVTDFPVNNATFTCDGSDLVVDFPAVGTTASVRMVPA